MTDGNAGFDVHGGCTGTERRRGDMVETLGPNGKYILTILLVLALVGLVAWLLRQFGAARRALSGSSRNRQPRLAVLDHATGHVPPPPAGLFRAPRAPPSRALPSPPTPPSPPAASSC